MSEIASTGDHLYVVGESETTAVVKIGRSVRPVTRLSGIQTGHPRRLRLLHVEDGAGHLEGSIHKLLDPHRTTGEWFDFGESAALETVRQAITALKAIEEIASRNSVILTLTTPPRPLKVVEAEKEAEEGAETVTPPRDLPDRPYILPEPKDPCEWFALSDVNKAAVEGFFSAHPDPTGYLREQGIPAHHIIWWYREFPKYGMEPSAELEAEAAAERADRSAERYSGGMRACALPSNNLPSWASAV